MFRGCRALLFVFLALFVSGSFAQSGSTQAPGYVVSELMLARVESPFAATERRLIASSPFSDSADVLLIRERIPAAAAIIANPIEPVVRKDDGRRNFEKNKKIWFSLMAASHGAAAFDAWSTRSAVGRGAQETNPFLRPFAGSAAMYPAAQVFPSVMDYVGMRMVRSNNRVLRKLWWLPQAASTIASFTAGVHNLGVAR